MTDKQSETKSNIATLIWINGFAALILIAIIAVSGQYKHPSFWLSTLFVLLLAFFITQLPRNLKFWRYPLIVTGLLLPSAVTLVMQAPPESTPDISAAVIIFLMALFWLPLICHSQDNSPCAK